MNILFRLIITTILMLVSHLVFADGGTNLNNNSYGLTIAPNDQSVDYLGKIFGQIGSVLNGGGSQVIGMMFGEFNKAVMIVGITTFTYVYVKGVVDTAAHGEFLGKQNNSLWIPIRSVLGIALMIPKASTGYAIIQVLMMWIVLQGVGAADMIWGQTVQYMQYGTGGSESSSASQQSAKAYSQIANTTTVSSVSQDLPVAFADLTCLQWAKEFDRSHGYTDIKYYKNYPNPAPSASPGAGASPSYAGYQFQYHFGAPYSDTSAPLVCGGAYWQTNAGVCNPSDSTYQKGKCSALLTTQKNAIQNIINTYQPIASYYVKNGMQKLLASPVNKILPPSKNPPFLSIASGSTLEDSFPKNMNTQIGLEDYQYAGSPFTAEGLNMYMNQVGAIVQQNAGEHSNQESPSTANSKEVSEGWMFAGSYYYRLVNRDSPSKIAAPGFQVNSVNSSNLKDMLNQQWSNTSYTPMANAQNFAMSVASAKSGTDHSNANHLAAAIGTYGAVSTATLIGLGAAAGAATTSISVGVIFGAIGATIGAFTGSIIAIVNNTSKLLLPITVLGIMGHVVLWIAMGLWIATVVGTFLTDIPKNVMNCMQPMGYASRDVTTYISGMFYGILAALLTVGIFLAVYLPLMPFLYFLFGVINWFIAVIETMIAAPIVALGIIHPEGHDVWGKAEPAVMLVLNVFLRPSLLLFGLVVGILLSFVGIQILSQGIALTMEPSNNAAAFAIYVDPIAFFVLVVFYVMLVVIIVQQSFKLIVDLPNRILQWLGSQGQLGGNMEEAMQQAKQQHGQAGQAAQQGFKQSEQNAREKARMSKQDSGTSAGGASSDAGNSGPNSTSSTAGQSGGMKQAWEAAQARGRKPGDF